MPIDQNFLGRESELAVLRRLWPRVKNGMPHLVLITADSGIGKTRLVQEFFKWLSENDDAEKYWARALCDSKKPVTIVPELPRRSIADTPRMPWLWLAVRCNARYRDKDQIVAFDAVRHQIAIHLASIFKIRKQEDLNKALFKAGFGLVASFALPGSGPVVEAISTALHAGHGGMSAIELYESIKERLGEQKQPSPLSVGQELLREQKSIVESATKAFSEILGFAKRRPVAAHPIVLFVDDAHGVDSVTAEVLMHLLKAAEANHWSLLVILACWNEPLRFAKSPDCNPVLNSLIDEWRNRTHEDGVVFKELGLQPLPQALLEEIAKQGLATAGDAAAFLAMRSGGDIDLLKDFLDEIIDSPGWLTRDGTLAVRVSDLERLPSKAGDMARQRLNRAGEAIRQSLTWASSQGIQFDEAILAALLTRVGAEIDIHDSLVESDQSYGFVKTEPHTFLTLTGEFRRLAYFDASWEFFFRHPASRAYLIALADVLRHLIGSDKWHRLDANDRFRIGQRYMSLIDQLRLKKPHSQELLTDLALDLALLKLQLGDARGAEYYARRAVNSRRATALQKIRGRKALVRAAYMQGHIEKEAAYLKQWRRSRQGDHIDRYICDSLFAMRQGDPTRSVAMAEQARRIARSAPERFDAEICAASALWSNGRPDRARDAIIEAERQSRQIGEPPRELSTWLHHTCALILHDLEKNAQVVFHARQCVDGYRAIGDKLQEIISKVNLGDALWGVGRVSEARDELTAAYKEAQSCRLPHAQDIAAICLANVLRDNGDKKRATELYQEGIELAKQIGHLWDQTYGEIYLALMLGDSNPTDARHELTRLRKAAEGRGYAYLAALADAFTHIYGQSSVLSSDVLIFPIVTTYHTAARVLNCDVLSGEVASEFLQILGKCEGIKGNRNFILRALQRIEHEAELSSVLADFVKRWRGRFVWDKSNDIAKQPRVVPCDYAKCEARCCYDGVYLIDGEEEKLRQVVSSNREFFSHVPDAFLVQGDWHGISGIKTAVRPHKYAAPDFPDHFSETRCVFAYEDGACSLQRFSELHGVSPWQYKPISCVMHPIGVKADDFVPPAQMGDPDPSYVGMEYPGYSTFTPCGQCRSDGSSWSTVFGPEMEYWQQKAKSEQD